MADESKIEAILERLKQYYGTYYEMLDKKAPFFLLGDELIAYPTPTVVDIIAELFLLRKRDFNGVILFKKRTLGEIWLEELEDGKKWISVIIPDNEPLLLALEEKIVKYGWVRIGRRNVGDVGDDMIRVDFEKKISDEKLKETWRKNVKVR